MSPVTQERCSSCAPSGNVHRRRWLTVLVTMATATLLAAVAQQAGVDLAVQRGSSPDQQVPVFSVTLVSLGVGLAAWALLTALERVTAKARGIWTAVASVVFLVSLAGPLGAVTPAATAVLLGLHALVAVMLVVGLRRAQAGAKPCDCETRTDTASRDHGRRAEVQ